MPSKTIYVSDDDLPLYRRAQELADGNLSAAISTALRRHVELQEGRQEGFDEIEVRVGPGGGRRQRFLGALLAEWDHSTNEGMESYRVYRTRGGRFAVHLVREERWQDVGPDAAKYASGWRSWVGNWSSDQTWAHLPAESQLHVADDLDALGRMVPTGLYHLVAAAVDYPAIEDLDI